MTVVRFRASSPINPACAAPTRSPLLPLDDDCLQQLIQTQPTLAAELLLALARSLAAQLEISRALAARDTEGAGKTPA